ncbi:MAG TPA: hypothetical protein VLZ81_11180 [Blastocatellia bacterium]|nr:hypothetical protein [Blastocatellia bacterium]
MAMKEEDSIFQPAENKAERDHSRVIMVLSGIAALIVVGAIVVVGSRSSKRPAESQMAQAGSAEFDSYAPSVAMGAVEKATSTTLIGRKLGILRAVVTNNGDKKITGLQIKALAVGYGGETLAQRIATPIPKSRGPLGPGESAEITVYLDPIPDPSEIMDMTLQVFALKVQ